MRTHVAAVAFLIALFFSLSARAQDQILFQGFEPGDPWTIISGAELISNADGAGEYPPSQRIRTGSYSWQVSNAITNFELASANITGYSGRKLAVRLSSTSHTSVNGADATDYIRVYVALDGAAFGGSNIHLQGNSNARWGYWGNLTGTVAAGSAISLAAPQGGQSSNNYATLQVTIPDSATSIAVRVTARNDDTNEYWNIDDVEVTGFSGIITNPPTVETDAASGLDVDRATVGGTIVTNGGAPVLGRGICYGFDPLPTLLNSTVVECGNGDGSFSTNLTGLYADTRYYYRAYASNSEGLVYGSVSNFITLEHPGETITLLWQSFEPTDTWTIVSGGGNISGADGAADQPPLARIRTGANSWQVNNGSATVTLAQVAVPARLSRKLLVHVSSTSSTNGGADTLDNVKVYAALNGADFGLTPDIALAGNNNSRWNYGAILTAVTVAGQPLAAAAPYANLNVTNYATLRVTLPDSATSIAVRVSALNNAATEIWNIDDIQVVARTGATTNAPTVQTDAVTDFSTNRAVLGGGIVTNGGAPVLDKGICYGTNATPGFGNGICLACGAGEAAFATNVLGLAKDTLYYVRAYASNSVGLAYGNETSFRTLLVATNRLLFQGFEPGDGWTIAAGADKISAATGADDTPANQRIRTGANSWQINGSTGTLDLADTSIAGYFGRKLFVRLSSTSTNAAGGSDSTDYVKLFVALDGAGFAGSNIYLVGNNNSKWGYDAALTLVVAAGETVAAAAPQGGLNTNNYATFMVNLPDSANSIAVRIDARNNDLTEIWNLDDIEVIGFTDPVTNAPTVLTDTPSNVSTNTATVGGSITTNGGAAVLGKGVCYGTNATPGFGNSTCLACGSGDAAFSTNLAGLAANTLYYVRAYASNVVGLSYGNQQSFTTLDVPPPPVPTNVLLFQGFEPADTWTIVSGGEQVSSDNPAINSPPGERIRTGTYSWQVIGVATSVDLASSAISQTYTARCLLVRVSSVASNTSNGMDAGDYVRVYAALDGAAFGGTADIQLNGNNNARWPFSSGLTAFTAAGVPIIRAAPQGALSSNNYATLRVNIPDTATSIAVRVSAATDNNNEILNIDDIAVVGFSAGGEEYWDGIPASWWQKYGLTSTNKAAHDNDGDTAPNGDEYVADTDPTNAASFYNPDITNVTGMAVLELKAGPPTSPDRRYDAYYTDSLLGDQVWAPLGKNVPGNPDHSAVTLTVTNDGPRRQYRTGVHLP